MNLITIISNSLKKNLRFLNKWIFCLKILTPILESGNIIKYFNFYY